MMKTSVILVSVILVITLFIIGCTKNSEVKPINSSIIASPSIQPTVATNITMEDETQVEQIIRDYLNYLDKQNYEEAWKLLAPQDRAVQTLENFMKIKGVKTIKLISLEGYSAVPGENGNTVVYDAKVPTVYFHVVLDIEPVGVTVWEQGRNERFIMGRKGIDGKWLISDFTTTPYLVPSNIGTNAEPEKIIVYNKGRSAAFTKGTEGYDALRIYIYKRINEISENNILTAIITDEFVSQFKQQLTIEFLYSNPVEFWYPNGSKKVITRFLIAPAAQSHTVLTSSPADKGPYSPYKYNGGLFEVKMDSSYEELLLKYSSLIQKQN